jgi:S-DNA-T family DNA segregation ATPase FtsK/SpoIIIE
MLVLVGFLTFISLLSVGTEDAMGAWARFLDHLVGWGIYILPIGLIVVGFWLILRRIERLPQMAIERLIGVILLYLNLLAFLNLLIGKNTSLSLAEASGGGGFIGGVLLSILITPLGLAGGVTILIAWLIIALMLTLDLSVSDLFHWVLPVGKRISKRLEDYRRAHSAAERPNSGQISELDQEWPDNFTPLNIETPDAGAGPLPVESNPPENQIPEAEPDQFANVAWVLPRLEAILDAGIPAGSNDDLDRQRGRIIEETLASFGAPAHVVEIHRGPTITQFGVEPDFTESRGNRTRVRVSKIVSLADDLALALAASRIRIQAPVPGRNYVGIEVPNDEISRVALRDALESEPFQKLRSFLRLALGKDVAGSPVVTDLTKLPHLLIAGTTGSGKSVCVNAILSCLLLYNTPDDLRLILVDPKRVELTGYNGIPHLLAPVVVDAERVVGALQWVLREMDNRYHKFARAGARNIQDYNNLLQSHNEKKLPYLVIVIDELADLMMLAPDETERAITRLAQLARATGIHLIIATQRPSVDVVTGLIKANFPARIAFAVASGVDSRVILDQPGAERLLGRGDMLFQAPDASAPLRIQGVFVSENEIQKLVDYWKSFVTPTTMTPSSVDQNILPVGVPLKQVPLWDDMPGVQEGDPLLNDAIDLIRREGRASISMLQRRMRVGYTRAARLIDTLEEKGIISPAQSNTQVRTVLDYGPTRPPVED